MTNTIAIGIDTAQAKSGTDDFKRSCSEMRGEFQAAQDRANAFNEAVASIKRNAVDEVTDSLRKLGNVAREATDDVRRLAAEMKAASKIKISGFLSDQREKVAGLIADLRAVALASDVATAGMVRFTDATRRAVIEGGRLQAVQARPSQLSGSSPAQLRIAGPIIDVQPLQAATTWFSRLREAALGAWNLIKRFASDQSGALSLNQIAAYARSAGSALSSMGSGAAAGGLTALQQILRTIGTTVGVVAVSAGLARSALSTVGVTGTSAFNAMRSAASAATSGIASLVSSLTGGLLNGLAKIAAFAGIGGFGAIAYSLVTTGDQVTLFDRKIQGLSDGVTSKGNEIRAAILSIADASHSSIEDSSRSFNKLLPVLQQAGNSIDDIRAMTLGVSSAMKLSGASTVEAARAMEQYVQGVNKGKLETQDLKSIAQSVPGFMKLIAEATGLPMAKLAAKMKEGGEITKREMTAIQSFFANKSDELAAKLASMPRTFDEALVQVKNQWFLTVEEISKNTAFTDTLLQFADKFRNALADPTIVNAISSVVRSIAEGGESFLKWIGTGDSMSVKFKILGADLRLIAAQLRAIWDNFNLFDSAVRNPVARGVNGLRDAVFGKDKVPHVEIKDNGTDKALDEAKRAYNAEVEAIRAIAAQQDAARVANEQVRLGLKGFREEIEQVAKGDSFSFAPDATAEKAKWQRVTADVGSSARGVVEAARLAFGSTDPITNGIIEEVAKVGVTAEVAATQISRNRIGGMIRDDLDPARESALRLADSLETKLNSGIVTDIEAARLLRIEIENLRKAAGGDFSFRSAVEPIKQAALGTRTVTAADSVSKVKNEAKGHDPTKQMVEKLNLMREENKLAEIRMTGTEAQIKQAELDYQIEKNITREMWVQNRALAEQIVGEIKMKQALEERQKIYERFKQAGEQITQTLWSNFEKVGEGTMKWKDALKDTLVQMIKLVAQAAILKPLMDSIGKGSGQLGASMFGGSGSGNWLSSLFGGGGDVGLGSWAPTIGFANGGAFGGLGQVMAYANGGTFGGNGSIVSSPTMFSGGGKLSVAGESGPEGILPLTRMPGGKLGVQAKGGSGAGGNTTINNTFNVAGDMTDATADRMASMVDQRIAMATPGITKTAVARVRREHTDNPAFLKR